MLDSLAGNYGLSLPMLLKGSRFIAEHRHPPRADRASAREPRRAVDRRQGMPWPARHGEDDTNPHRVRIGPAGRQPDTGAGRQAVSVGSLGTA